MRGIVFVWIHNLEAKQFIFCYNFSWYSNVAEKSEHLTMRGESINYVNCHI